MNASHDRVLSDREQLYDLMVRYGRANDTKDIELFRTCFTDDVVFEVGYFGSRASGLDALAEHWLPRVKLFGSTHHFSNFSFDLEEEDGSFSCLLMAQHWPAGADGMDDTPTYLVGGRYDVTVRRLPVGWRASRWHLTLLWSSGDPTVLSQLGAAGAEHPAET